MARLVHKHQALELLGICDHRIRTERTDLTRRTKRTYTPVPADPTTIGQHIHRKRLDEGLTQKQLAARWGVWRATLGSWEADHYEPEGRKRAKVVAWLGFDPRTRLAGGQAAESTDPDVGNLCHAGTEGGRK